MRYTVVWTETALGQLARVWTDCPDRGEVNREVDRIDAELGEDPETKALRAGDCFLEQRGLPVAGAAPEDECLVPLVDRPMEPVDRRELPVASDERRHASRSVDPLREKT